jgi:hypothetical protein
MKGVSWRLLVSVSLCLFGSGCGASIQAIYEADVRFEHCMALDAQPDVDEATRRACWTEWVTYYTYGQTRDRVLHAQLRIQQLNGTAERVESSRAGAPADARPPQLGKSQSAFVEKQRAKACESQCDTVHAECMETCKGPETAKSCRPGCDAGLRSCEQQCQ